jgi:hypothetical protein
MQQKTAPVLLAPFDKCPCRSSIPTAGELQKSRRAHSKQSQRAWFRDGNIRNHKIVQINGVGRTRETTSNLKVQRCWKSRVGSQYGFL